MNEDHTTRRLNEVLKNTAYLMLAEVTRPLLSFLLVLIISRNLGKEGMGVYTIIFTFLGLFELIGSAGLAPLMVRGIAADKSKLAFYVSGSLGVALLSTALLLPTIFIMLWIFHYPPVISLGIRLLSFTLALTTIQQYVIAVCEGLQNMKLRAIISMLDTLGRLCIGGVMIVMGYGVTGLVQGVVFIRVFTTLIALCFLVRVATIRLDFKAMLVNSHRLMRDSFPFLLMTIASTVFWSTNTLMLSKLASVEDVGAYNAAYRIVDILKTVLGSYLIVLLPMMSASFIRGKEELKRDCDLSIKYLALVTLPLATGCSALAPRIIRLIYGQKFDQAIPILQILIWTVCVFCLALVFARVLVASHKQLLDMYCNVAALVINIGVGWVFIRRYGALGAAIATLISLVIFGILEYLIVTSRIFRTTVVAPLLRAGIASAVMAIIVSYTAHWPLLVVIPVATLGYLAALLTLGTFSRTELRTIGRLGTVLLERTVPFLRREPANVNG